MHAAGGSCRPLRGHPRPAPGAPPPRVGGAARTPRRIPVRAGGREDPRDSGAPGEGSPDIDELAALLSKRAAELRASGPGGVSGALPTADGGADAGGPEAAGGGGDETAPSSSGSGSGGGGGGGAGGDVRSSSAAGAGAPPAAGRGAAPRGSGGGAGAAARGGYSPPVAMPPSDNGFVVTEFQVYKTLGQLGVASARDPDAPTPLAQQPVFVYVARYVSGLPYEGPTTVLLKEYQAPSVAVAANEALVQSRLLGPLPERKWQAAVADAAPHPPVVQLLGWLSAPPSDGAYEITRDNRDATWLVYRFEGLKPLSVLLPSLAPPAAPPGLQSLLLGGREAAAAAAAAARTRMLRAFAARLLGALSFCHARGVAHCCLGGGSVQCSGLDDRAPERVIVKLDNWGLARLYPGPLEPPGEGGEGAPPSPLDDDDSDARDQRRADLQAAGLLLVEAFAAGTAGGPAARAALGAGEPLRRLLFEVFHDDVREFRGYCDADEGLAPFVDWADATGAWGLLQALLRGDAPAGELLRTSAFFAEAQGAARGGG